MKQKKLYMVLIKYDGSYPLLLAITISQSCNDHQNNLDLILCSYNFYKSGEVKTFHPPKYGILQNPNDTASTHFTELCRWHKII